MKITVHKNKSSSFVYEDMICRMIRCNDPLLRVLHLEVEDVYQELAIAAMQASYGFDPVRSDSLEDYMWTKLHGALLDMKRDYHPAGLTGLGGARPSVTSLEYCVEYGVEPAAPENGGSDSDLRLRKALRRLDPQEREAVLLYLEDQQPHRGQQTALRSGMRKLREFYRTQITFC